MKFKCLQWIQSQLIDEIQMSTMDPKPTYKEVATDIFGTQMNPTAGPIYYVSDSDIADTITNSIFSSLTEEKKLLIQMEKNIL